MRKILILISLHFAVSLQANDLNYGLYFNSYEKTSKDRTSLVLNNGEALAMKDGLTLSFDLFIRKEIVFGYIVRIISNSGESVSLNFSAEEKDHRYPSLIVNENFYPISNKIEYENWFPVSIRFSPRKDSLYLSYGTLQKSFDIKFTDWKNIKISFGCCPFPGFGTMEPAAMNLRDVKIREKDKLIRHWALKEHDNTICYDRINHVPATTRNPCWIIDNHTKWTEIYTEKFDYSNNPQYTFDAERERFYIVPDEKTVLIYNPVSKEDSIIYVKEGYPAGISTNGLIYDHLHDELVSYNLDDQSISRFSFKEQKWSRKTLYNDDTRFWHHTASINNTDSTLVTFGGYGYYKYKNDLFKINLNDNTWERNKILTITPRYSSASVIVDNKLYIFGGRGSETSKQEVNPQFYYDFYSIDLNTYEAKLLWKTQTEPNFLPCGNLIYNAKDSCFYMLTNIENGTLFQINANNPQIKKVSLGIKASLEIREVIEADFPFYTLFFSPRQKKIYALFCGNYKIGKSNITLYEIEYPPLSQEETLQKAPEPNGNFLYISILAGLIALSAIALFFVKQKKRKANPEATMAVDRDAGKRIVTAKKTINKDKQRINLLGGFNIRGKNGENITSNFTPILKNLLLLILLYSEIEEKGINDKKIDNLLWYDKDNKAARNNRNVSLSRLKLLLENIGEVTLINNGGFWKISYGENTFCDYHTSFQLMKAIKLNSNDKQNVLELLELLMYGPLLPYTQFDWLDKFKSNYSNDAIDILYNLLLSQEVIKDIELGLQIADTIFLFDSINEEALGIKCSILYHSGKKSLAKSAYDTFAKEYKMLLGENFKYSFSQVLSKVYNG
ncbi:MAG: hypothetical protein LBU22_11285 [Dysgonamonadaceae bacterium]|jgi:DNA-binding SARP family transcriptional activator|nr:hypothetical protein [Dysgonamonadaceae bacterium]